MEGCITVPRHFTDEERELFRTRLLDVGLEMFERYGLDKTNIEELTREVGISKASFYNFFNSKGDLFMQVYQREREKVHEFFREKYDNMPLETDVGEMVAGYARDMREILAQRPILNIMYKFRGLDLISEAGARESLLRYNHELNMEMAEMIQGWMDRRGTFSVSGRIIAETLRSLNFLRWHDYAIGYDVYDEVIEYLTTSIVNTLRGSKLSDQPADPS